MIGDWSQGFDGITYIIEHSDRDTYWFKHYWTPSAQDSIPESLMVLDFINKISDTLNLNENYKKFLDNLPHRGCYNSGGMVIMCYISNLYGVGYYGSTKLPLGYSASVQLSFIGNLRTDFGLNILHQLDGNGNYDFSASFGKGNIFTGRSDNIHDFLSYGYRRRELDLISPDITHQNHKVYYGLTLNKNFDIAVGTDYLIDTRNEIGGLIYATKWINKPKLSILTTASVFRNNLDYKLGISKSFFFNKRSPLYNATIGFYYERFKKYNDLSVLLSVGI
jgi:hypothetical protein